MRTFKVRGSRTEQGKRPASVSAIALLALLPTIAATACASKPLTPLRSADAISAEYDTKIAEVRDAALAEFYWPVCQVPPKKGRGCGLLADAYLKNDAIERFVTDVCHEASGPLSDDCVRAYRAAFMRHVRTRYTQANDEDVARVCESDPRQCQSLQDVELLFLASHNAALRDRAMREIDRLLAEHAREQQTTERARTARAQQEEDNRRAWAAVGAALQGFADGARAFSANTQQHAQAAAPSVEEQPRRQRIVAAAVRTCTSDYSCGIGEVCSKPAGSISGECAKSVNEYGVQNYGRMPNPDSFGVGQRQCNFDVDCGIGFACAQGRCLKR